MRVLNFILANAVALFLTISCSQVVENEKIQTGSESSVSNSGDMQGALVQLTGTVTEVEDVETKEKKIGLSINGEEVVILKIDDPKLYVKGELVKIKATLVEKLSNDIRVFKPIELLKQCLSEENKSCFKPPFLIYPVVLKGVLHKIETDSDKPILTLIKEDKVLQLSDVDALLEDNKEGDEIAVAGYFKSKFSDKLLFKTLVVKKLITDEDKPSPVVKELDGRFVKTHDENPVFLTDEGKIIKLAKYDGTIFLGEKASVKIKFVKTPMDVKEKVSDLLGDFLSDFSILNKLKLNKKMSLISMDPKVVLGYVQSVNYENCSEEQECSQDKVALLGYHLEGDKDILFVSDDYKVELELSVDDEGSAEVNLTNKLGKKLAVVTGEFKEKILVADKVDYLTPDVWSIVESSLDFLKKRNLAFWSGFIK
jgi:hypothetical protein